MNVFLIGFMGCGKSFLGKELARQLHYTFIETDAWIEQMEDKSISQIFTSEGEMYFRKKESVFLHHLQTVDYCVVATGGGMPCYANNMEQMNELGTTLWLDVDENILMERLEKEKEHRPMLANSDNLKTGVHHLLEARKPFYTLAHHIMQNPTIDDLLSAIAQQKI